MALRAHWLCLTFLAHGLRVAAADPSVLPDSPVRIPVADADAPHDLIMAASCIERGQETAAITYLARYVAAYPDRVHVRAYLAELLWRRERFSEAKAEFETFLSDAQVASVELKRQVHGHTRLMTIAGRDGDAYAEHLHRGIGLFLLGRQVAMNDEAAAESWFCKAAGELTRAYLAKSDAARPHWYLYLVWSRLGQTQPAARGLDAAIARRRLSDLTPAEQRDLVLTTAFLTLRR